MTGDTTLPTKSDAESEMATSNPWVDTLLTIVLKKARSGVVDCPFDPDRDEEELVIGSEDKDHLLMLDSDGSIPDAELAKKAALSQQDYLIGVTNSSENVKLLHKYCERIFALEGNEDKLYGTNFDFIIEDECAQVLDVLIPEEETSYNLREETVQKCTLIRESVQKADQSEERTVLGVVYEPDVVDSQGDFMRVEEIRKMAHRYMEERQIVGYNHDEDISTDAKVIESYLLPFDGELSGRPLKKGTWIIVVRILNDQIWAQVKNGKLTGFSFGGSGVREPATV